MSNDRTSGRPHRKKPCLSTVAAHVWRADTASRRKFATACFERAEQREHPLNRYATMMQARQVHFHQQYLSWTLYLFVSLGSGIRSRTRVPQQCFARSTPCATPIQMGKSAAQREPTWKRVRHVCSILRLTPITGLRVPAVLSVATWSSCRFDSPVPACSGHRLLSIPCGRCEPARAMIGGKKP
jgi:hypothetical protein